MSDTGTEADDWVHDTFGVNPSTFQQAPEPEAAPGGDAPGGFFSSIGDAISSAASSVADTASSVASSVADTAVSVATTVADTATSVATTVADTATSVATTVADTASSVATSVADTAVSVATTVADTATSVAGTVADAVSGAANTVADAVEGAATTVVETVQGAIQAIEDLFTPAPPTIVGPAQQARAEEVKGKLSPEDKAKYEAMVDGAKTPKEKQYLEKGLASGHTMAELEAFQKKIAGKDEKWLQDNLSLTGNSDGKGVKQQWHMSCNATAVQAVRGEMDPLYALQVHEENPDVTAADGDDPTTKNTKLAAEQKAMLETDDGTGYKGVALPRDHDNQNQGRWNTDLLNAQSDSTGMTFTNKKLGADYSEDDGIKSIDDSVAKGMPVPIVIGNSSTAYTHYVVVTGCDPGPPKIYTIHDPWEGVTYKRTDEQLRTHKLDIANSNQISAVEVPAVAPVK